MGVGSSRPASYFPLRRKILAQGGSLLVSVCLEWVVLATCFCWPAGGGGGQGAQRSHWERKSCGTCGAPWGARYGQLERKMGDGSFW